MERFYRINNAGTLRPCGSTQRALSLNQAHFDLHVQIVTAVVGKTFERTLRARDQLSLNVEFDPIETFALVRAARARAFVNVFAVAMDLFVEL